MGKTTPTNGENHQVILRSPLPRIHYYQSQVVTSIRNLTKSFSLSRNTNLQLNPYPNTQLNLYYSGNLSLDTRIPVRDKPMCTRGVHGSVRVGFVPNPIPTRRTRVENVLTRRRPARESDRSGRFFAGNTVGSVETVHGEKSGQNS